MRQEEDVCAERSKNIGKFFLPPISDNVVRQILTVGDVDIISIWTYSIGSCFGYVGIETGVRRDIRSKVVISHETFSRSLRYGLQMERIRGSV